MEFKSFCDQIVSAMSDKYPESEVELSEITKNNGVDHKCLTIKSKDCKVSEVIYLEPLYDAFINGCSFNDVLNRVEIARLDGQDQNFDVGYYRDFDKVRERVMIKLVNYDKNQKLLAQMPHRKYKDFAVLYYCLVGDKSSEGIIMIKNEHIKMWDVTENDLYDAACVNAIKNNDYVIMPLMEIVNERRGVTSKSALNDELSFEEDSLSFLKILTNKDRTYGAATIMNPGLLYALACKYDSNYYILPSSVHELILVIDEEDSFNQDKAAELYDMVRFVNMTEVATEDVLSDNVYYYDRNEDELFDYYEIASKTGLA